MEIILPDGSKKAVEAGATIASVAASIGAGLAKAALAGSINGTLVDLSAEVAEGDSVAIITKKSPEALDILRHSTAHVMAEAVLTLFPAAQVAIGPSIEDGFYYDFSVGRSFSTDDLAAIEAEMDKIIAADEPFVRQVVSRAQAQELFADQALKLELLSELPEGETITVYHHGAFTDLCRGPHLPSPAAIGAYKLTKVAGAYWRGDSEREMLQRIYGTAWFSPKDLATYLFTQEEAEKRDHRKLGRELGIYTMLDEVGPGLPLFLPKGARIVRLMQEWLRKELYRRGYDEVITPHIYKSDVWKTSGHYYYYHDDMYFFNVDEGEGRTSEFGVKPMNCPGHVLLYKNDLHSYREMPIRYFEFGTVYRAEMSGAVHGLFRARGFTQDDAHVFCRQDQVVSEVESIMDLVDSIMSSFDLEYSAEVSTRPEKSIGTDEMWELAESYLKQALQAKGLDYSINEGDGAFYGPKIDIKIKDSIGRTWQCSTIQVDFNNPERFDISYRTAENGEERPWMLHRAIFGSIERFLGVLIEHYAGALPLWLSPVQVAILPLADRHIDACKQLASQLRGVQGRVEIYDQNEPMRVKIAKAQAEKVPYMVVMGDKEIEAGTVSVRDHLKGDLGTWETQKLIDIIAEAQV
ncbi:MAG: threonine--tRNA ligase [Raoultibacter sp.]